ncbi:unnamed protein product, partial [marine sediment metagenome]
FYGGGGIFSRSSSLIISHNIIRNNDHSNIYEGGGIFAFTTGPVSIITISNNRIENNATTNNGGGIRLEGVDASSIVTLNTIISNTCGASGAGIYISNCSPQIIENDILSNIASGGVLNYGGGIYISPNSHPDIIDNDISENEANNSAAIHAKLNSSPTIRGNLIIGNTITTGGGAAMRIEPGANPLIDSNKFMGNAQTDCCNGGALRVDASCTIINNLFSHNFA